MTMLLSGRECPGFCWCRQYMQMYKLQDYISSQFMNLFTEYRLYTYIMYIGDGHGELTFDHLFFSIYKKNNSPCLPWDSMADLDIFVRDLFPLQWFEFDKLRSTSIHPPPLTFFSIYLIFIYRQATRTPDNRHQAGWPRPVPVILRGSDDV